MKLRKYILTVMIGITAMTVLSSCANKENAVKDSQTRAHRKYLQWIHICH